MIDPAQAEGIVDTILDELIRGKPPASLPTWPQALARWDGLSEQAQIELRRALVSLVLAHD